MKKKAENERGESSAVQGNADPQLPQTRRLTADLFPHDASDDALDRLNARLEASTQPFWEKMEHEWALIDLLHEAQRTGEKPIVDITDRGYVRNYLIELRLKPDKPQEQ